MCMYHIYSAASCTHDSADAFEANGEGEWGSGERGEEYESPPTLPAENWRENPDLGVAADAAAAVDDMCCASARLDRSCIARFGHFILITSETSTTNAGRPFLVVASTRNNRTLAMSDTNAGV